jgi:hypothetical protein
MRILLIVITILTAAAVVDNLWLDGRNSHAVWQEANYQAQQFRHQVDLVIGNLIGR